MENKLEEVKIVHSQHARILKEDEEVLWISSEDLNTENSTDDERSKTRHAFKKKLKLKDRKRSSPNIRLYHQRSSNAATSNNLDDRLLISSNEEIHSRSTVLDDESRTSDEEYQIPSLSECLSKRLSLEEWRPMKGTLNISSLEEAASSSGETTKIIHETETFYQTMLDNLNSLKSCSPSVIQKNNLNNENFSTLERSFIKNTPEVQNRLDFIIKLDREIDEIISSYKVEREERLGTQFEMCKIISEEKLNEERGTEIFLRMCNYDEENFKLNQKAQIQIVQPIKISDFDANNKTDDKNYETDKSAACSREFTKTKNFVKKNIYAAKEGIMANLALTDEEKIKVSELLCDIDSFKLNDAELTLSTTTLSTNNTLEQNDDDNKIVEEINDSYRRENAFLLLETDKTRIGEIDNELEQFTDDVPVKEKNSKLIPVVKDEEFWKNYVIDQSLKEIDSKLEKLYESYKEDELKLKYIPENEKMIYSIDDDLGKQQDEIFM